MAENRPTQWFEVFKSVLIGVLTLLIGSLVVDMQSVKTDLAVMSERVVRLEQMWGRQITEMNERLVQVERAVETVKLDVARGEAPDRRRAQ